MVGTLHNCGSLNTVQIKEEDLDDSKSYYNPEYCYNEGSSTSQTQQNTQHLPGLDSLNTE